MDRISTAGFAGDRLDRPGRYAVCFSADWCPFCQRFARLFEEWQAPRGVHRAVIDLTDTDSPLWDRFDVQVVPTLAVFVDGELTWRRNGRRMRGLKERDLADLSAALAALPS